MKELVDFLTKYIEEEHKCYIFGLTTESKNEFKSKYSAFKDKYYRFGIENYKITTPTVINEETIREGLEKQQKVIPRVLFQIKAYNHPLYQELYRCYAMCTAPSKRFEKAYMDNLFIIKQNDSFIINSIYTLSPFVDKLKTDLSNWEHEQGDEIAVLGDLVEVKKFHSPENKDHLKEYNTE